MVGSVGTNLERRIGDYMSGGGAHGGHGGREEHDPSHMSAAEFLEHIRGFHKKGHHNYVEKHEDRVKKVHEMNQLYNTDEEFRGKLHKGLKEHFSGKKASNYAELHKKVNQSFRDNDKEELDDLTTDDHFKDLAHAIMIDVKYGVEGDKELNYTAFQRYMESLGDEGKKYLQQIKANIKNGRGYKAAEDILNALKKHKDSMYDFSLLEAIVSPDTEFHDKYATFIGKNAKEETGEEVFVPDIARNIKQISMLAGKGDYGTILENYRKPEKAAHGHSAGHGGGGHGGH